MPEPVKKYALFIRTQRITINTQPDGTEVFSHSGGPFDWTLLHDTLYDTIDAANMEEMVQRVTLGHETAIREVVIPRPPDSLFDDIHG